MRRPARGRVSTLYSVGHGGRSARELSSLLADAKVVKLVDVRAVPASRRHPQFARAPLAAALEATGIAYDWRGEALGGFRRNGERSPHSALKQPMFRAYAAHMDSRRFLAAAAEIARQAASERLCFMCAEQEPSHCHRSLIADWLVARGHQVLHLIAAGEARAHALNAAARIAGGRLIYDRGTSGPLF